MNGFRKFVKGIILRPETTDPVETNEGQLSVNSTTDQFKIYLGGTLREILTSDALPPDPVTNKRFDDSTVWFVDTADNTKNIKFDASGTTATGTTIAAAQTANRVVTLPDATDTLVGRATTDTLTNKTIDAASNTILNIANANIAAAAAIAYSKLALANSIVNADINAAAAIAYAKLALTNSIVNADIAAGAAIAYAKLALANSIVDADINAAAAIAYSKLNLTNSIVNADIAAAAAIAYSKLNLTNSILNADINASAAIAYTKLNLTGSIVNADIAAAANIARSKLNAGTANRVVVNDGSGVMTDSAVTTTELGRLSGILSSAVGVSDTQNLTNKTMGDALSFTQIATPSNPSAGFNKLYPKSDNTFYTLDSTGNEVPVGSGSGSGGQNYISNPTFNSTANGYAAYADAPNPRPVDGTGGSPTVTITRTTSSPLHGAGSGLITKDAANRQGEGVSTDITVDNGDQAKMMVISFDYQIASGTFQAGDDQTQTDSDLIVYVYRTTATGRAIEPIGFRLKGSVVGVNYSHKAYFATDPDATGYRIIFHVATTSAAAFTFKFDNLSVSTQVVNYAPLTTDWTAYTPTFTGFGTVTGVLGFHRRNGNGIELRVYGVSGTPTSTEARVSLPPGINTASNASMPDQGVVGRLVRNGVSGDSVLVLVEDSVNYVTFGVQGGASGGQAKANADAFIGTADGFSFNTTSIAVSGWNANAVAPEQAEPRLVAASYGSTSTAGASPSTPIVYNVLNYDTHGSLNPATGVFTAPFAGIYSFVAEAFSGTTFLMRAHKNGTFIKQGTFATGSIQGTIAGSVYLAAGDTLDIRPDATPTMANIVEIAYFDIQREAEPATISPSDTVLIKYGLSGNTAVATNGTIPFDTKEIDTHGAFAAGVFTAPVVGYYRLSCMLSITTSDSHGIYMQKNGSIDEYTGTIISTVNSGVQTGVIQMDAGDTLTLKTDSAITVVGSGGSPSTSKIAIERIG